MPYMTVRVDVHLGCDDIRTGLDEKSLMGDPLSPSTKPYNVSKQLRQLIKKAPKGKPVPVLTVRNNQPLFSAPTVR